MGKVRRWLGRLPFVRSAVALYYCARDARTPFWAKVVAWSAVVYLVSPIDFVPDVIPWLGFADDAGAIMAAVRALRRHVTDEHREKARAWAER